MARKPITKDAPLKAYAVADMDEENGAMVFARFNAEARRKGANILDSGDFEYTSCRRAPEFDSFAPGPVPIKDLMENGWWHTCFCPCGRMLRIEDEPLFYRRRVYCDRWGPMREVEDRLRHAEHRRLAVLMAREALPPGVTISDDAGFVRFEYVDDGAPGTSPWQRSHTARRVTVLGAIFTFPGGQFSAEWWHIDPERVRMSRGDMPAWEAFRGRAPAPADSTAAEA